MTATAVAALLLAGCSAGTGTAGPATDPAERYVAAAAPTTSVDPVTTSVPARATGTGPAGRRSAEPTPTPTPTPTEAPTDPQAAWQRERPSVTAPPERVLAGTDTTKRTRIVTVRDVGGRPTYSVETTSTTEEAVAAVERGQEAPGALSVAVDTRVHVSATADDTYRARQWPLDRFEAESLWAARPGAGVTVAVVDSGVQGTHEDLASVVLPGTDFVTDGLDGRTDPNGHGTHVAGIIGAVANNGRGVAGLAQGVNVLPIRALDADGYGWSSDVAAGITYAVDHGAQVVNLSVGGGFSSSQQTAANYALSRNVVLVAAAGNERLDGNPVTYPANLPGVVGVAATDRDDAVAPFSNYGAYVDIAAPGVQIISTYAGGGYRYLDGTSMATPYVAAAAALMRAARPTATPAEIAQALASTALDLGAAGRDNDFGHGLIDPAAAVAAVVGTPAGAPSLGATPATESAPTAGPTPSPSPTPPPAGDVVAPAATSIVVSTGPHAVAYGGRLVGSARILDATSRAPRAHAPVQLCRRTASPAVESCTTQVADETGTVSWRWRATANTTLLVTYPGTGTTAAATGAPVRYAVAARAVATPAGRRVKVAVRPAGRTVVTLQVKRSGQWVKVRTSRTAGNGRVTFTQVKPDRFRVVTSPTAANGRGVSAAIRLRR